VVRFSSLRVSALGPNQGFIEPATLDDLVGALDGATIDFSFFTGVTNAGGSSRPRRP
jgi:hypothetical protein